MIQEENSEPQRHKVKGRRTQSRNRNRALFQVRSHMECITELKNQKSETQKSEIFKSSNLEILKFLNERTLLATKVST
jgi:hypothetical protein